MVTVATTNSTVNSAKSKECICNQCLDEFPEDHTFCKLTSTEDELKCELEETDVKFENLSSLECAVEDKLQTCLKNKAETILLIEDATNANMRKVVESRRRLLLFLDGLFGEVFQKIDAQLKKTSSDTKNSTEN